jgi:uncharacterized protein DUF4349
MPATDTIDFEREFEALVRDLRALPTAAPEDVREQVRAFGEPAPSKTLWVGLPRLQWRRAVLVLAPACVLGLVTAAVIHGVLNSGPTREAAVTQSGQPFERMEGKSGAEDQAFTTAQPSPFGAPLPVPAAGRLQDYEAWMSVRVKDLDALSDQANEAMRVARAYGGYVVSLEQATAPGRPGQADLVLRVPVARVEDALMRLAGLGTVIERHLSIHDLEQTVQQQRARILKLKLFIARATAQLKGNLPADVRLRLQLQLEQAQGDLSRATNANKATLREASLSRIALTLTTQKAVGAGKKDGAGRIERAARDAGSFLAAAGAVALFVLIVLSPLLLLAAAAVWGSRAHRRREERRLLSAA